MSVSFCVPLALPVLNRLSTSRNEHWQSQWHTKRVSPPRDSFTAAEGSAYSKYFGTGLGLKLRMHPIAATLARLQLDSLSQRTETVHMQVRQLNDRLTQLSGLYEQTLRPDVKRDYYAGNLLFLDESAAGMSRQAAVRALQAEGVRASAHVYRLQHKCTVYTEQRWWHHLPQIPELPGTEQANRTAISLPLFRVEAPELVDQYIRAFEKVWARRQELPG